MPCVLEPFERNNVARAVHEKAKFEAIRDQFAEVRGFADNWNILRFSQPLCSRW